VICGMDRDKIDGCRQPSGVERQGWGTVGVIGEQGAHQIGREAVGVDWLHGLTPAMGIHGVFERRTCVGVCGLRKRTGSTVAVVDGTRRQRRWSAPSVSVVMSRCQSRMGSMVCALGIRWGLVITAYIHELGRHQS